MEGKINAKSETQSARGAETGEATALSQQDCESRTGQPSEEHELLDQRASRAVGERVVAGGILARMIEDKRDRIREVDECLEWYQREKQKRLLELADLEQFAGEISGEPE